MMGDYGGGGMFLAFGIVCGILEARTSGQGQVIDVAMVDGTAVLMSAIWGFAQSGIWLEEPGVNMLDTGRAYYDTYATSDGKWISFGAIEDQFFAEFLERVGFDPADFPNRTEREAWPEMHKRFTELFLTKTRDEWCELLEGTDVCFAPVLPMSEAKDHPHIVARGTIVEENGMSQPAPAPRFSRTPGEIQGPAAVAGEHTDDDTCRLRLHQRGDRRTARVGRGGAGLTVTVGQRSVARAASTRSVSAVGSSATTVTWPSLRPGRGALP